MTYVFFVYRKNLNSSKCPLDVLLPYPIYFHSDTSHIYTLMGPKSNTHTFIFITCDTCWCLSSVCSPFLGTSFSDSFMDHLETQRQQKWCLTYTTTILTMPCEPHYIHGDESQYSALFILCAAVSIIR